MERAYLLESNTQLLTVRKSARIADRGAAGIGVGVICVRGVFVVREYGVFSRIPDDQTPSRSRCRLYQMILYTKQSVNVDSHNHLVKVTYPKRMNPGFRCIPV